MRPRAASSRLQPSCDALTSESEHQPEAQLVLAIFHQAIHDVRVLGNVEAWLFLTSETGRWAASRRDLSWLIGVNPDNLRRNVLKAIKPPANLPPEMPAPGPRIVRKKKPVPMRVLIVNLLAERGQPMHTKAIAAAIDRDVASLSGIIHDLVVAGTVERVGRAVYAVKTSFQQAA